MEFENPAVTPRLDATPGVAAVTPRMTALAEATRIIVMFPGIVVTFFVVIDIPVIGGSGNPAVTRGYRIPSAIASFLLVVAR